MGDLTNLRGAVQRHSTPGSLVILVCAMIVFGPRIWDTIRGEPWIDNQLTVMQGSTGAILVEDLTLTRGTARGVRINTIEDEGGAILCSAEHHNSWLGERKRMWRIQAFVRCSPPIDIYRVCSRFSVASDSGRQRYFGPFCSGVTKPE